MPLSLRFVVPLALALAAIAYAVVPLVDRFTFQWFVRDLDTRGALIAKTAQDSLAELVSEEDAREKVLRYFDRIIQDQRIYALGYCDRAGRLAYATAAFPQAIRCTTSEGSAERNWVLELPDGPLHVSANRIATADENAYGELVIVHDMSAIARRSADTKKYVLYLFAAIATVVALITVVIAEISWRGWVAGMKALLAGETLLRSPVGWKSASPELRPIARDLQALVLDLESERRSRDESQTSWGPDALRRILRQDLKGDEVLIVSNREPYIHTRRKDNVIEIQRPASGLVTALEPIVRATSGTWIAHGAGTADRDTVDQHDHVMVPPEHPAYRIRRVWLSKEEEQGYYFGFANEGLWPLCHRVHVRPEFRSSDFDMYWTINERFVNAVDEEAAGEPAIVLVQDYHFAMAPLMLCERDARHAIVAFWHIPWPTVDRLAICPWATYLLEGLLASSLVGFQTQSDAVQFLDAAEHLLGAQPTGCDDTAQSDRAVADDCHDSAGADPGGERGVVAGAHHVREREQRRHQGVVLADGEDDERAVRERHADRFALAPVEFCATPPTAMDAGGLQTLPTELAGAV